MKRLFALLLVVLVMLFSVLIAHSETTVDVSAFSDSVLKNRLFEISIQANPHGDICAGEIVLSYDINIVEFREAYSDCYFVEATDRNGEVSIVFGSAYSKKTANNSLVTVKFKALSEGTFDLRLSCNSFVDEELNAVSVSAYDTQITVNKSSVKSKGDTKTQKVDDTQDKEIESLSTDDELFVKQNAENKVSVTLIICICVVVIAAFLLGVFFAKKSEIAENDDDDFDY